ncbi:TPA: hypothetical protein LAM73_003766 [Escherichia coli]|uniref:hypothetical protein n=1 Tax=Escherichia albertii TaxID=208962 RepID=UPI000906F0D2|nr:hypothetical protein [Escherichia albertii]EFS3794138.1 hypothetical protein [Escherichia coli]EKD4816004.1 hypothetical protein [Escherichia albertii]EKY9433054.1 hypothetical protein [Escherichia coli]HBJ0272036.1 hypothetical protein [Escherichia coli]
MARITTYLTVKLTPELNHFIEMEARKHLRSKRQHVLCMLLSSMEESKKEDASFIRNSDDVI